MRRSRPPARYRLKDVQVLVEGYAELREQRGTGTEGGVLKICKCADIDRALRALTYPGKHFPKRLAQRKVLLIHGQFGLTVREAAEVLGEKVMTVQDRYTAGLTWLTTYLNGET